MSSTSPHSNVQAARQAVAQQLREIRLLSGKTQEELTIEAGWRSASKCSRIENVVTPANAAIINTYCRICGVPERAPDLIAQSLSTESMYTEWKRFQRGGLRRIQESSVPLYERTRSFRVYCSNVIPGFLQTRDYATALLTQFAAFQGSPNDVAEAVEARLKRSRILREGDHRFALLVEEAVLRYRLGSSEAMAGQLGQLLSVMALPSVSLGVVPFSVERQLFPQETFSIFDTEMVRIELLTAQVSVTTPTEISQYVKAFSWLSDRAVYGTAARALIAAAIEAVG